jgi:predicted anti-sigma-YlaC factor YlaD
MSCLRLEQVYLYLEGELDPSGFRVVEDHLNLCPSCRRAVEERRAIHEASLMLPPVAVPQDFSARVLARIPVRSSSPLARTMVFAAGIGTLAFTLLGAILVMGLRIPAFLVYLNRTLWNLLGRSGATLGKALGVLSAGLKIAGELFGGLGKVLETFFASFLPEGTAAPALFLGLILSFLLVLGMRRLLFTGEKI